VEYATGVTDLAACLGRAPDASRLLGLVLVQLHRLFEVAAAGFSALRGVATTQCLCQSAGEHPWEAEALAGTCAGVDDDGALLLQTPGAASGAVG
jgi:BirA family biotin operon repressor/biotin-[acetyl-CoA-carboxylase] ligase